MLNIHSVSDRVDSDQYKILNSYIDNNRKEILKMLENALFAVYQKWKSTIKDEEHLNSGKSTIRNLLKSINEKRNEAVPKNNGIDTRKIIVPKNRGNLRTSQRVTTQFLNPFMNNLSYEK